MENALQKIFSVKDFSIMKNTFQKRRCENRILYYEKCFSYEIFILWKTFSV